MGIRVANLIIKDRQAIRRPLLLVVCNANGVVTTSGNDWVAVRRREIRRLAPF